MTKTNCYSHIKLWLRVTIAGAGKSVGHNFLSGRDIWFHFLWWAPKKPWQNVRNTSNVFQLIWSRSCNRLWLNIDLWSRSSKWPWLNVYLWSRSCRWLWLNVYLWSWPSRWQWLNAYLWSQYFAMTMTKCIIMVMVFY